MKSLKILVFFGVIINPLNAQNWTLQNSGTNSHLLSVYFIDKYTGYASGIQGTILKTTDGGNQWAILNSGTQCDLNSIFFPAIDTGFAVASCGWSGAILNTGTSGTYWDGTSYPLQLYSVYFLGINEGFAAGMNGTIIKTINGGINWITQFSNTSNSLFSINFPVSNVGYAVGAEGTILKTTNGGDLWIAQNSGTNQSLYSVFFLTIDTGYAVGSYGTTLKTINGGTDWIIQNPGTTMTLQSVYFIDGNTGFVVGGDNNMQGIILKTINGGTSWEIDSSDTYIYLNSVFFTDSDTGYVVGIYGTILKTTDGGGVGMDKKSDVQKLMNIYPNPVNDALKIEVNSLAGNSSFSISNVNGQELLQRQITTFKTQIDISTLPAGVYFIRFKSDKTVGIEKLIKQ